jgi:predicted unusual protein kinase regulating ubiquinone biosynthesis (AarF/ABC1/UbiB family)
VPYLQGLLPVLDVAATGFLQELDYMQEAANGARFEKEMNAVKGMQGVIKVPSVVLEYSSRHVLVQVALHTTTLRVSS